MKVQQQIGRKCRTCLSESIILHIQSASGIGQLNNGNINTPTENKQTIGTYALRRKI